MLKPRGNESYGFPSDQQVRLPLLHFFLKPLNHESTLWKTLRRSYPPPPRKKNGVPAPARGADHSAPQVLDRGPVSCDAARCESQVLDRGAQVVASQCVAGT
jgi:hypothetical protein